MSLTASIPSERYICYLAVFLALRGDWNPICLNLTSHTLSVILRIKLMRSLEGSPCAQATTNPSTRPTFGPWSLERPNTCPTRCTWRQPVSFCAIHQCELAVVVISPRYTSDPEKTSRGRNACQTHNLSHPLGTVTYCPGNPSPSLVVCGP